VVDRVTAAHERLEFGETGRAFYDFFWSQYADWYIESAKPRLYGADAAAAQTTRAVRLPSLSRRYPRPLNLNLLPSPMQVAKILTPLLDKSLQLAYPAPSLAWKLLQLYLKLL
jgi:hypothetical protein